MSSHVSGLARLADSLDGAVLQAGQDGYDAAGSVWNAMVDRRPAVIVKCASRDDVAAAIRFARDHDLEIGVKCGGHSVIGHSVPGDGLMIDLTLMNAVTVDPATRQSLTGSRRPQETFHTPESANLPWAAAWVGWPDSSG